MKRWAMKFLVWYKKYLSIGNSCRFIPTCSEYTYEAIDKYGLIKGGWMGLKRVWRCRPGGGSGIDLVQ